MERLGISRSKSSIRKINLWSYYVIKKISVSYGMESGLNEAIEQSAESLSNVKLIHEKNS